MLLSRRQPRSPLFPYTTLFRSLGCGRVVPLAERRRGVAVVSQHLRDRCAALGDSAGVTVPVVGKLGDLAAGNSVLVPPAQDRKSTRLNSSHSQISYAVFCLKKK